MRTPRTVKMQKPVYYNFMQYRIGDEITMIKIEYSDLFKGAIK